MSALTRAYNTTAPELSLIRQSEFMARVAGIALRNSKDAIDQRTMLYGILRTDANLKGTEYHHCQMSDQHLFAEVLRMLGDVDSLNKLITTHPHISFDWNRKDKSTGK